MTPSSCVSFYGINYTLECSDGDEASGERDCILVLQKNYLLSVKRNIWDPENRTLVKVNLGSSPSLLISEDAGVDLKTEAQKR